jgi:integration host factor subunit alpha
MSLTKKEIIDAIYTELDIPRKECVTITESIFEIIKKELGKGKAVRISGFGKWSVKSKRKRKGRNPKTGEEIMIDARRVVTFKPSPGLKEDVNGHK